MKQAGGEPQRVPPAQRQTVGLQQLPRGTDQWPSPWVLSFRDSSEHLPKDQLKQGDVPPPGQVGSQRPESESPAVGPCKFTLYLIFYLGVATLFTICMAVFYATLSLSEPKYKLERSLVGTSPGLGLRPMIDGTSALIKYQRRHNDVVIQLTKELDAFLKPYSDTAQKANYYYDCDFNKFPPADKVCKVNISQWSRCTSREGYGYGAGTPCVFIKLNRIYDWEPDYYNRTSDLPREMPEDLRKHIQSVGDEKMRNVVWVSCGGVEARDTSSIGALSYIPSRGFPGYFYPYRNQRGYLSPLVAVRFEKPKRGVNIKVECKAWARNIVHSRECVLGMVRFQLMVD